MQKCMRSASKRRRIIWQEDAGSRRGLFADFQNINMHAISSDQSEARKPCIYMQLEPSSSAFADTTEGEADDDRDATPEVRLVPEDSSKCEPACCLQLCLKLAACHASTLHRIELQQAFTMENVNTYLIGCCACQQ